MTSPKTWKTSSSQNEFGMRSSGPHERLALAMSSLTDCDAFAASTVELQIRLAKELALRAEHH